MNPEIKKEMETIKWWHKIDLGEYGITNGSQGNQTDIFHFDDVDFKNKTVLDIGAVDGLYSFEAEKRGAKEVLAVDSYAWQSKPYSAHFDLITGKRGFDLARKVLNSKVKDMELQDFDEDIVVEKVGKHDIVLCLGILYHMKDPFKFIRQLYDITNELLVLETQTDVNREYAWKMSPTPLMAFYPHDELNNDPTNWWGPNVACVSAMLQVAGFTPIRAMSFSSGGRLVVFAYKKVKK